MLLRLHSFLPASQANGPGRRAVIWVQGCSIKCEGCYNPATHPFHHGRQVSIQELMDLLIQNRQQVEGLTVTGGEPFDQVAAITDLLVHVKQETSLSTVVFTGYSLEEIMPNAQQVDVQMKLLDVPSNWVHTKGFRWDGLTQLPEPFRSVDILIAGRYDRRFSSQYSGFQLGNKKVYFFSDRYSCQDLLQIPPAELVIGNDGRILFTGTDPADCRTFYTTSYT